MNWSRREFLHKTGKSALVGAVASGAVSKAASGQNPAPGEAKKPHKMIVRVDDVGYTDVVNIGTFKAIDSGIPTAADVMFDSPGTVDALVKLRERPWISIGWHAHFWGKPVLGPEKVPSLVGKDGHFKWSMRDGTALVGDNFVHREAWVKLENEIDYDQAVAEFRAQIERCVLVAGRAPISGGGTGSQTLVGKAHDQVAREYGMKSGFLGSHGATLRFKSTVFTVPPHPPKPEYAELGIYEANRTGDGASGAWAFAMPAPFEPEKYNPMDDFRNNVDNFMDIKIPQFVYHPGFLDDYIVTDGGITFTFNRTRPLDVAFLCSQEIHDWMRGHRIELISTKDALTGSNEFQTHLKEAGSDLCVF